MFAVKSLLPPLGLLVILRFGDTPNLDVPAIRQEITAHPPVPGTLIERQFRLVCKCNAILQQPIRDGLLIEGTYPAAVRASVANPVFEATGPDLQSEFLADLPDDIFGPSQLFADRPGRQSVGVQSRDFGGIQRAILLVTGFPDFRPTDVIGDEPMHYGARTDPITFGNLPVGQPIAANHPFQVVSGRRIDPAIGQPSPDGPDRDAGLPEPYCNRVLADAGSNPYVPEAEPTDFIKFAKLNFCGFHNNILPDIASADNTLSTGNPAINEYGHGNIPPNPFMRRAFLRDGDRARKVTIAALKAGIEREAKGS